MQYLLDTCVVSDFVKGDPNTLQRLKLISPDDISISAVTSIELKYGLAINPQRAIKIQPLIISFLNSVTILPFAEAEAEQTAQIRSFLKQAGTPIGAYDVLIAATAITHKLIIVTANVREFERIPNLQIENWRD
ncbi:MAG: type II toxin-antitoxin system VapC family toxin [Nostocales cyanobacterium LacPavin_0920_SED1_MAG_38_18]|jgi:tRNA(fMet)-specific endonuclease VapC|uniref:type II toxin-antitoxin system VapC family toxin n=1 Tax=Anabaena sp. WA102 TaxID=1647413 RepID=UPI0006AC9091|nr:type II toxin-antitoxin system VapC family toxin [Anabaena sp. WA102]ALB42862.1 twitching motility protein PilT [Anabaena sp. WA102]MCX5981789.1 type II toxin-antitoxin system VapC family toxin [Nostocales cyanobacterium LacPavin_0920_SED1_MAG_38_18]